jgi:hypothetical protein
MFSHALRAAPGPPVSPLSGGRGDDEEALITHYPLGGLLPPGQGLAFHRGLGTLAHLTIQEDRAVVLGEQQFTEAEITLLVPLLDNYPHHCPYEVLWTSFAWNTTAEEAVTRARPRLQAALEQGGGDAARAQRHLAHPVQAQPDGAGRAHCVSPRLHPGRASCAAAGPGP